MKNWWESKTIWTNGGFVLAWVLAALLDQADVLALPANWVALLGILQGAVNVGLRLVTNQPVELPNARGPRSRLPLLLLAGAGLGLLLTGCLATLSFELPDDWLTPAEPTRGGAAARLEPRPPTATPTATPAPSQQWAGLRAGDYLGSGVAVLDASGAEIAAVGAPGDDSGALNAGAIYLSNGTRIDGPKAGAQLGRVLAAVGDMNGDGLPDLAASATDGVWLILGRAVWPAKLRPDARACDVVATALAGGDLDGNGYADLLIGDANWNDRRGRVLCVPGQPDWSAGAALVWIGVGVETDQYMGAAVAGGDWNTDGRDDVIGGAPGGNYVRVFGLAEIQGDPDTEFGRALAWGPGGLLVGAPYANSAAGGFAGAVYRYAPGELKVAEQWAGDSYYAGLGAAVAWAGEQAVLGAPTWDHIALRGRVYVYLGQDLQAVYTGAISGKPRIGQAVAGGVKSVAMGAQLATQYRGAAWRY